MGSVFSYLCCGCCGQQTDTQKLIKSRQKKNLKLLKDITPTSTVKAIESPLDVKTTEMTDFYKVPSHNYATEADVFKKIGYTLEEQIDSGGFATVYRGVHINKKLSVACKKMTIPPDVDAKSRKKRLSLLTDIKNELYVLQKIEHPNVIKMILHFIIVYKKQMTFYIMMQMAQGGNLSNKLEEFGPFNEKECKRWFAQILSGLKYMHSRGIAHRDLKLPNILLDETQDVLISDFGLSRLLGRQSVDEVLLSKTYCGTPPYMAPEVLEIPIKKMEFVEYNAFVADIWSCGIILFKLFNKRYPFSFARGQVKAITHMKARKWHFERRLNKAPTDSLKDIMNKLLEPEPTNRISMEKLVAHEWIRQTFCLVEEKNNKRMSKKS